MRTVGVEEELLLGDVHTGNRVQSPARSSRPRKESAQQAGEGGLDAELQRYMVETQSSVASELGDVPEELRTWRHVVANAARDAGAGVATIGTAPPQMPTSLLRLAVRRAGHDGLDGVLVDPVSGGPRPWIEVMRDLVRHQLGSKPTPSRRATLPPSSPRPGSRTNRSPSG